MLRGMAPKHYSDFVSFLFDRPETSEFGEWYWEDETACPGTEDEQHLVHLMGYLFRNCGKDLSSFSDTQVAMGLEYLTHNAVSDLVFALMSQNVPSLQRAAAIKNLKFLYSDLLAARCAPALGHRNEREGGRLNMFCYMLWDITPLNHIAKRVNDPDRLNAILNVLAGALRIGHPACTESALHGLGHMQYYQPERVNAIIDDFLAHRLSGHTRREELEAYARAARTGMIQ